MPGNEIGDRVHNFFPQGNLPQELHHSPALGSNWSVSSDSPWAGSQRQVPLGSSNVKNYNLQQPDGERGHIGNHLQGQNDFPQLTLRPEFSNNQPPAQPSNVNGFWDRDTNYNQHNLGSRGLLNYGSQQPSDPENQTKSSVRAVNPGSSLGFDLFGGQQPMNNQQLSMLQSLRHQLSGKDMQQLQQQVMFMKMQELQRQQQLQQVDVQQQQNAMNQNPSFSKQASGTHFLAINNSSQNTDGSSNSLANDLGTNRMQRSSPSLQGSSYMLAFSPNQQSPAQSAVDVPKQNDQSLYGVPVSSSRGVLNQYRPDQQQASFGSTVLGSQFSATPGQLNTQNGNSFAKQRFQVENSFGSTSGQVHSPARALQRNSPQEEFNRMQRNVVQENLVDKTEMQITSPEADVALDPTEERILFGSDDNIWSAFGKSQEDGNGFDGGAFSALMQSAVDESSGGDSGVKEEGSGLNFQLGNEHFRACNDGGKQEDSFAGGNSDMFTSGFGSGSNDTNMNKSYENVVGFQQFGGKSHPGSGSPQGLAHSSQEGGEWSNGVPAHEPSMVHINSSHSPDTTDFRKSVPGSWRPENSALKQDGYNAFGSVTNYRDGDVVAHVQGNSLQHPWGIDRTQVMQGEVAHVGAPWTLDPISENVQVNNDGFGENNSTKIPDSTAGQRLSSSYPINNWKFVDPLVTSKVNETVRNSQHYDNAPLYNDPIKENEMENSDNQENSNDSRRSSLSHQRKTVYSDSIDSKTKAASMHKYNNNQTDLRNSDPQYYPMRDLGDMEPCREMKQPLHSQAMSHFPQQKFFGQMPNNFVEMGKGQPLGSFMASVPSMQSPFNRIGDTKATNMASMSSENMLELLHKVDQSGDHCAAMRISSSHPSSSSELPPAEKSDGQLRRSLSSHSQGFNLQLGPPQRQSITNHSLTSQSYQQMPNSTHSSYYGAVDTGHHDGSSSVHVMPSSRIERNDVHKVPENFNSSFLSRDQVQNSGTVSISSEKEASNSTPKWDSHLRPLCADTSFLPNEAANNTLLPDKVSGGVNSQGHSKALSSSWTNIVAQQHLLGPQFRKHLPQSYQTMRVNPDSLAYMNQCDQDTSKREAAHAHNEFANGSVNAQGFGSEEYNNLSQKENTSHGNMPFSPAHLDGSSSNTVSTQSDIEAFGRSLKPNHFQQNLSMLNPMRGGMPVLESDPNQLVPGVQLDDYSDINLSGSMNNAEEKPVSLEHGNDTDPFHHSKISQQMSPSLFNHYEALKNEHISSLNDSQPFIGGKASSIANFHSSVDQLTGGVDIGASKVACIQQSANVDDQYPMFLSTKKRKSVTSQHIPWCKEVSHDSGYLQNISMAEIEWSKASNRPTQKVEEDVEFLNEGPPMIRSKRRLILTTQLMQQLLPPPPSTILSMNANSDHEMVNYSVSRLALGEACSMVSPPTNEEDAINRVSGDCKTSDEYLLKAAQVFTARARKLESDFSRVCKGASLVDMFVEYQDVEKVSVINRFAKFYGRGQSEKAETRVANMQILCPQRYVTAIALPRSLPIGVQCHSL